MDSDSCLWYLGMSWTQLCRVHSFKQYMSLRSPAKTLLSCWWPPVWFLNVGPGSAGGLLLRQCCIPRFTPGCYCTEFWLWDNLTLPLDHSICYCLLFIFLCGQTSWQGAAVFKHLSCIFFLCKCWCGRSRLYESCRCTTSQVLGHLQVGFKWIVFFF